MLASIQSYLTSIKVATVGSPEQSPNVSPGGSARRGGRFPYEYDSDIRTRSVSPDSQYNTPANGKNRRGTNMIKINNMLNVEQGSPVEPPKNRGGRPKNSSKRTYDGELKPLAQRIVLTKGGRPLSTPESVGRVQSFDRSSPVLPSTGPRPRMTSHQIAVQQNRNDRINHVIERKLQRLDRKKRRLRLKQGTIVRAWNRIKDLEDPLLMSDDEERPLKHVPPDHDEEGNPVKREDEDDHHHPTKRTKTDKAQKLANGTYSRGPAGLIPRKEEENAGDEDDFGEEAMAFAAAIRRTARRLARWQKEDERRIAAGLALVDSANGQALDVPVAKEENAEGEGDAGDRPEQDEDVSDEDDDEDVQYR
ncbi:hypothetical protein FN846DRAFT_371004 [Sphaerosporella brunnea]|uniref:Uncharacterized protein n=1 Tax=Sphaerosporella brunnea TaxID=1250544 RepID=A0A5J5EGS2_9PEZI|nr:hypothetical protein FN846DRAFT_371004 [Sphaerosporella brunnea]